MVPPPQQGESIKQWMGKPLENNFNILEYFGIFWNIFEYYGIFQNTTGYLSNIDCLQGNTTYITRTEGEGDICQSYCPEGSQYYY